MTYVSELPDGIVVTPVGFGISVEQVARLLVPLARVAPALTLEVACGALGLREVAGARLVSSALRALGYDVRRWPGGARQRVWSRGDLLEPPPASEVVVDPEVLALEPEHQGAVRRAATRSERQRGWLISAEGPVDLGKFVDPPDPVQVAVCDAWLRVFVAGTQGRRAHDMPRTASEYAREVSLWVSRTANCIDLVGPRPDIAPGAVLQAMDDLGYSMQRHAGGVVDFKVLLKTNFVRAVRAIPSCETTARDDARRYTATSVSLMARVPSFFAGLKPTDRTRSGLEPDGYDHNKMPTYLKPFDPPVTDPTHWYYRADGVMPKTPLVDRTPVVLLSHEEREARARDVGSRTPHIPFSMAATEARFAEEERVAREAHERAEDARDMATPVGFVRRSWEEERARRASDVTAAAPGPTERPPEPTMLDGHDLTTVDAFDLSIPVHVRVAALRLEKRATYGDDAPPDQPMPVREPAREVLTPEECDVVEQVRAAVAPGQPPGTIIVMEWDDEGRPCTCAKILCDCGARP